MGASIRSSSYGMQPELRPVGAGVAMQSWVSKDPSDSWPQVSCSWQINGTYSLGYSSMGKLFNPTWSRLYHTPAAECSGIYICLHRHSLWKVHTRGPNSSGRAKQGTKGLAECTLCMLSCHFKALQPAVHQRALPDHKPEIARSIRCGFS